MSKTNGHLVWMNEKRRLGDLIPWPRNPRQIREKEAKRLAESFDEFGQVETLAVGPGNEIYNGHQRLNVLAAEYGPDYEVDVRVASRPLTEKEREKLVIYLHKGAAGEWNFDVLSEWDVPDLLVWGFKEYELGLREKAIINHDEMWQGMPEFENDDVMGDYHTLKVHFHNEEDVKAFSELIGQTVTEKTKWLWYPKQERLDLKNYRVKDES